MQVEIVAQANCLLAENPLWNVSEQALYWTDIPGRKLYRYFPDTRRYECFYEGEVVGGFTFQEDNSLLLFGANSIARLSSEGVRTVLREGIDTAMKRFNDVIADPFGRVFAGSIGATKESGGLYRVDPDGAISLLFQGTGCSNGLAFSPDLQYLYWTCTTTSTLFRFKYNLENGELSERTTFYVAPGSEGNPDGMTIDTEGNLWTCRYAGSTVLKLNSSGKLVDRVELPVRDITSAVFGGPNLDELYVTTAGGKPDVVGLEGGIFKVSGLGRGLPEFRSKYLLGTASSAPENAMGAASQQS